MASGSSVGDGYGPMVVSKHPMQPEDLKGKRIAIPGKMTTAYLALKLFEPDFEPVVVALRSHPGSRGGASARMPVWSSTRLSSPSPRADFTTCSILGRWWKKTYNLPLPLGANVLLRSLEPRGEVRMHAG